LAEEVRSLTVDTGRAYFNGESEENKYEKTITTVEDLNI